VLLNGIWRETQIAGDLTDTVSVRAPGAV